jgi:AraC-like DNA-binding protein
MLADTIQAERCGFHDRERKKLVIRRIAGEIQSLTEGGGGVNLSGRSMRKKSAAGTTCLESHVPSWKLPSFLAYLEGLGLDANAFLGEFPACGQALREKAEYIPLGLWLALNARAADLLGDPDFGLNYGSRFGGMPSLLGYLLRSCERSGDALEKYIRYQSVEHGAWAIGMRRRGNIVEMFFIPSCPEAQERLVQDFVFSSFLSIQESLTGLPARPLSMGFSYRRPPSVKAHQDIFRCPLEFSRGESVMALSSDLLERKLKDANSAVRERLEHPLERSMLMARKPGSIAVRVLDLIARAPRSERIGVDRVAAALGLGVRDLQLKLKAEGSSFKEMLSAFQRQSALELLDDPAFSIQEVSSLLGYSDPSAFNRAIIRWTGKSPSAYRRAMREASR